MDKPVKTRNSFFGKRQKRLNALLSLHRDNDDRTRSKMRLPRAMSTIVEENLNTQIRDANHNVLYLLDASGRQIVHHRGDISADTFTSPGSSATSNSTSTTAESNPSATSHDVDSLTFCSSRKSRSFHFTTSKQSSIDFEFEHGKHGQQRRKLKRHTVVSAALTPKSLSNSDIYSPTSTAYPVEVLTSHRRGKQVSSSSTKKDWKRQPSILTGLIRKSILKNSVDTKEKLVSTNAKHNHDERHTSKKSHKRRSSKSPDVEPKNDEHKHHDQDCKLKEKHKHRGERRDEKYRNHSSSSSVEREKYRNHKRQQSPKTKLRDKKYLKESNKRGKSRSPSKRHHHRRHVEIQVSGVRLLPKMIEKSTSPINCIEKSANKERHSDLMDRGDFKIHGRKQDFCIVSKPHYPCGTKRRDKDKVELEKNEELKKVKREGSLIRIKHSLLQLTGFNKLGEHKRPKHRSKTDLSPNQSTVRNPKSEINSKLQNLQIFTVSIKVPVTNNLKMFLEKENAEMARLCSCEPITPNNKVRPTITRAQLGSMDIPPFNTHNRKRESRRRHRKLSNMKLDENIRVDTATMPYQITSKFAESKIEIKPKSDCNKIEESSHMKWHTKYSIVETVKHQSKIFSSYDSHDSTKPNDNFSLSSLDDVSMMGVSELGFTDDKSYSSIKVINQGKDQDQNLDGDLKNTAGSLKHFVETLCAVPSFDACPPFLVEPYCYMTLNTTLNKCRIKNKCINTDLVWDKDRLQIDYYCKAISQVKPLLQKPMKKRSRRTLFKKSHYNKYFSGIKRSKLRLSRGNKSECEDANLLTDDDFQSDEMDMSSDQFVTKIFQKSKIPVLLPDKRSVSPVVKQVLNVSAKAEKTSRIPRLTGPKIKDSSNPPTPQHITTVNLITNHPDSASQIMDLSKSKETINLEDELLDNYWVEPAVSCENINKKRGNVIKKITKTDKLKETKVVSNTKTLGKNKKNERSTNNVKDIHSIGKSISRMAKNFTRPRKVTGRVDPNSGKCTAPAFVPQNNLVHSTARSKSTDKVKNLLQNLNPEKLTKLESRTSINVCPTETLPSNEIHRPYSTSTFIISRYSNENIPNTSPSRSKVLRRVPKRNLPIITSDNVQPKSDEKHSVSLQVMVPCKHVDTNTSCANFPKYFVRRKPTILRSKLPVPVRNTQTVKSTFTFPIEVDLRKISAMSAEAGSNVRYESISWGSSSSRSIRFADNTSLNGQTSVACSSDFSQIDKCRKHNKLCKRCLKCVNFQWWRRVFSKFRMSFKKRHIYRINRNQIKVKLCISSFTEVLYVAPRGRVTEKILSKRSKSEVLLSKSKSSKVSPVLRSLSLGSVASSVPDNFWTKEGYIFIQQLQIKTTSHQSKSSTEQATSKTSEMQHFSDEKVMDVTDYKEHHTKENKKSSCFTNKSKNKISYKTRRRCCPVRSSQKTKPVHKVKQIFDVPSPPLHRESEFNAKRLLLHEAQPENPFENNYHARMEAQKKWHEYEERVIAHERETVLKEDQRQAERTLKQLNQEAERDRDGYVDIYTPITRCDYGLTYFNFQSTLRNFVFKTDKLRILTPCVKGHMQKAPPELPPKTPTLPVLNHVSSQTCDQDLVGPYIFPEYERVVADAIENKQEDPDTVDLVTQKKYEFEIYLDPDVLSDTPSVKSCECPIPCPCSDVQPEQSEHLEFDVTPAITIEEQVIHVVFSDKEFKIMLYEDAFMEYCDCGEVSPNVVKEFFINNLFQILQKSVAFLRKIHDVLVYPVKELLGDDGYQALAWKFIKDVRKALLKYEDVCYFDAEQIKALEIKYRSACACDSKETIERLDTITELGESDLSQVSGKPNEIPDVSEVEEVKKDVPNETVESEDNEPEADLEYSPLHLQKTSFSNILSLHNSNSCTAIDKLSKTTSVMKSCKSCICVPEDFVKAPPEKRNKHLTKRRKKSRKVQAGKIDMAVGDVSDESDEEIYRRSNYYRPPPTKELKPIKDQKHRKAKKEEADQKHHKEKKDKQDQKDHKHHKHHRHQKQPKPSTSYSSMELENFYSPKNIIPNPVERFYYSCSYVVERHPPILWALAKRLIEKTRRKPPRPESVERPKSRNRSRSQRSTKKIVKPSSSHSLKSKQNRRMKRAYKPKRRNRHKKPSTSKNYRSSSESYIDKRKRKAKSRKKRIGIFEDDYCESTDTEDANHLCRFEDTKTRVVNTPKCEDCSRNKLSSKKKKTRTKETEKEKKKEKEKRKERKEQIAYICQQALTPSVGHATNYRDQLVKDHHSRRHSEPLMWKERVRSNINEINIDSSVTFTYRAQEPQDLQNRGCGPSQIKVNASSSMSAGRKNFYAKQTDSFQKPDNVLSDEGSIKSHHKRDRRKDIDDKKTKQDLLWPELNKDPIKKKSKRIKEFSVEQVATNIEPTKPIAEGNEFIQNYQVLFQSNALEWNNIKPVISVEDSLSTSASIEAQTKYSFNPNFYRDDPWIEKKLRKAQYNTPPQSSSIFFSSFEDLIPGAAQTSITLMPALHFPRALFGRKRKKSRPCECSLLNSGQDKQIRDLLPAKHTESSVESVILITTPNKWSLTSALNISEIEEKRLSSFVPYSDESPHKSVEEIPSIKQTMITKKSRSCSAMCANKKVKKITEHPPIYVKQPDDSEEINKEILQSDSMNHILKQSVQNVSVGSNYSGNVLRLTATALGTLNGKALPNEAKHKRSHRPIPTSYNSMKTDNNSDIYSKKRDVRLMTVEELSTLERESGVPGRMNRSEVNAHYVQTDTDIYLTDQNYSLKNFLGDPSGTRKNISIGSSVPTVQRLKQFSVIPKNNYKVYTNTDSNHLKDTIVASAIVKVKQQEHFKIDDYGSVKYKRDVKETGTDPQSGFSIRRVIKSITHDDKAVETAKENRTSPSGAKLYRKIKVTADAGVNTFEEFAVETQPDHIGKTTKKIYVLNDKNTGKRIETIERIKTDSKLREVIMSEKFIDGDNHVTGHMLMKQSKNVPRDSKVLQALGDIFHIKNKQHEDVILEVKAADAQTMTVHSEKPYKVFADTGTSYSLSPDTNTYRRSSLKRTNDFDHHTSNKRYKDDTAQYDKPTPGQRPECCKVYMSKPFLPYSVSQVSKEVVVVYSDTSAPNNAPAKRKIGIEDGHKTVQVDPKKRRSNKSDQKVYHNCCEPKKVVTDYQDGQEKDHNKSDLASTAVQTESRYSKRENPTKIYKDESVSPDSKSSHFENPHKLSKTSKYQTSCCQKFDKQVNVRSDPEIMVDNGNTTKTLPEMRSQGASVVAEKPKSFSKQPSQTAIASTTSPHDHNHNSNSVGQGFNKSDATTPRKKESRNQTSPFGGKEQRIKTYSFRECCDQKLKDEFYDEPAKEFEESHSACCKPNEEVKINCGHCAWPVTKKKCKDLSCSSVKNFGWKGCCGKSRKQPRYVFNEGCGVDIINDFYKLGPAKFTKIYPEYYWPRVLSHSSDEVVDTDYDMRPSTSTKPHATTPNASTSNEKPKTKSDSKKRLEYVFSNCCDDKIIETFHRVGLETFKSLYPECCWPRVIEIKDEPENNNEMRFEKRYSKSPKNSEFVNNYEYILKEECGENEKELMKKVGYEKFAQMHPEYCIPEKVAEIEARKSLLSKIRLESSKTRKSCKKCYAKCKKKKSSNSNINTLVVTDPDEVNKYRFGKCCDDIVKEEFFKSNPEEYKKMHSECCWPKYVDQQKNDDHKGGKTDSENFKNVVNNIKKHPEWLGKLQKCCEDHAQIIQEKNNRKDNHLKSKISNVLRKFNLSEHYNDVHPVKAESLHILGNNSGPTTINSQFNHSMGPLAPSASEPTLSSASTVIKTSHLNHPNNANDPINHDEPNSSADSITMFSSPSASKADTKPGDILLDGEREIGTSPINLRNKEKTNDIDSISNLMNCCEHKIKDPGISEIIQIINSCSEKQSKKDRPRSMSLERGLSCACKQKHRVSCEVDSNLNCKCTNETKTKSTTKTKESVTFTVSQQNKMAENDIKNTSNYSILEQIDTYFGPRKSRSEPLVNGDDYILNTSFNVPTGHFKIKQCTPRFRKDPGKFIKAIIPFAKLKKNPKRDVPMRDDVLVQHSMPCKGSLQVMSVHSKLQTRNNNKEVELPPGLNLDDIDIDPDDPNPVVPEEVTHAELTEDKENKPKKRKNTSFKDFPGPVDTPPPRASDNFIIDDTDEEVIKSRQSARDKGGTQVKYSADVVEEELPTKDDSIATLELSPHLSAVIISSPSASVIGKDIVDNYEFEDDDEVAHTQEPSLELPPTPPVIPEPPSPPHIVPPEPSSTEPVGTIPEPAKPKKSVSVVLPEDELPVVVPKHRNIVEWIISKIFERRNKQKKKRKKCNRNKKRVKLIKKLIGEEGSKTMLPKSHIATKTFSCGCSQAKGKLCKCDGNTRDACHCSKKPCKSKKQVVEFSFVEQPNIYARQNVYGNELQKMIGQSSYVPVFETELDHKDDESLKDIQQDKQCAFDIKSCANEANSVIKLSKEIKSQNRLPTIVERTEQDVERQHEVSSDEEHEDEPTRTYTHRSSRKHRHRMERCEYIGLSQTIGNRLPHIMTKSELSPQVGNYIYPTTVKRSHQNVNRENSGKLSRIIKRVKCSLSRFKVKRTRHELPKRVSRVSIKKERIRFIDRSVTTKVNKGTKPIAKSSKISDTDKEEIRIGETSYLIRTPKCTTSRVEIINSQPTIDSDISSLKSCETPANEDDRDDKDDKDDISITLSRIDALQELLETSDLDQMLRLEKEINWINTQIAKKYRDNALQILLEASLKVKRQLQRTLYNHIERGSSARMLRLKKKVERSVDAVVKPHKAALSMDKCNNCISIQSCKTTIKQGIEEAGSSKSKELNTNGSSEADLLQFRESMRSERNRIKQEALKRKPEDEETQDLKPIEVSKSVKKSSARLSTLSNTYALNTDLTTAISANDRPTLESSSIPSKASKSTHLLVQSINSQSASFVESITKKAAILSACAPVSPVYSVQVKKEKNVSKTDEDVSSHGHLDEMSSSSCVPNVSYDFTQNRSRKPHKSSSSSSSNTEAPKKHHHTSKDKPTEPAGSSKKPKIRNKVYIPFASIMDKPTPGPSRSSKKTNRHEAFVESPNTEESSNCSRAEPAHEKLRLRLRFEPADHKNRHKSYTLEKLSNTSYSEQDKEYVLNVHDYGADNGVPQKVEKSRQQGVSQRKVIVNASKHIAGLSSKQKNALKNQKASDRKQKNLDLETDSESSFDFRPRDLSDSDSGSNIIRKKKIGDKKNHRK